MATMQVPEQMPQAKVAGLLAAKAGQLDAWNKTIRNAARGARKDGRTRYVGFTQLGFFIGLDRDSGGAYRFECRGDGTIWRIGRDD